MSTPTPGSNSAATSSSASTPGLYRLLRRTKEGKLRIDKAKVADEARSDGKFVLRSDDDSLSPTELALGYKQLSEVERGWRDLKGALRLRPVFRGLRASRARRVVPGHSVA